MFNQLAETELSLTTQLNDIDGSVHGRFIRPRFAHHTIWHAFAPAPFHSLDTEWGYRNGPFRISAGGDVRQYQDPAEEEFGIWHIHTAVSERAYGARAALNYSLDGHSQGRQIGLFCRGTDGFGGRLAPYLFDGSILFEDASGEVS